MKNIKKSLILSALCVASLIIVLGYSAYGWFSLSRQVRAIGQNISVDVPENLQISLSEDGEWSESVNVDMRALIKDITANDERKFDPSSSDRYYLLPASTYSAVDGSIWNTGKANYDGSAATGAVFSQGNRIIWNPGTTSFEGHYIDVPLFFRTDGNKELKIALDKTKTSITSVSGTGRVNEVVRIAFLNSYCNNSSMGGDITLGNTPMTEPLIYSSVTSTSLHGGVVIKDVTADNVVETKEPLYLTFTDNKSEQILTVKPGVVTKIHVRIWVEGQDKACTATIGGQAFDVKLGFCIIEQE